MDARPPRVCLALVWHMHQPHYEDPRTGQFQLPWVRLHGTKDYYDMAAAVEPFPRVRVTINVVPSLLEQIDDYVSGRRTDRFLELSRKDTALLDPAERRFVAENFFSANEGTMILRYSRYAELYRRSKDRPRGRDNLLFSEAELRDLIVLFNLAWIDPTFLVEPELKRLADQGRNFTEEEKGRLLDRQLEILGAIVPLYRRLAATGKIELSTTPYYHPILPLLLDAECAHEANPNLPLPRSRIQFPEDFDQQVRTALDQHEAVFGVLAEPWIERMPLRDFEDLERAERGWLEKLLADELNAIAHRTGPLELAVLDLGRPALANHALLGACDRLDLEVLDFSELTYARGAAVPQEELMGAYAGHPARVTTIGGLWLQKCAPRALEEEAVRLGRRVGGYWIFTSSSLALPPSSLFGPYTLQAPAGEYWQALARANERLATGHSGPWLRSWFRSWVSALRSGRRAPILLFRTSPHAASAPRHDPGAAALQGRRIIFHSEERTDQR